MERPVWQIAEDLIERGQNILIAGMTGSGKSNFLHSLINSILVRNGYEHKMILLDLKRVELSDYKETVHCIKCSTTLNDVKRTLAEVSDLIQTRLDYMEEHHLKIYDGATIHLIVDELAELTLKGKEVTAQLQSICEIGRAAKVQVICATQCPLAKVIPTEIKVNFPVIVGLHTATAQHSRNILETNGCEELRMPGEALILYPTGLKKVTVPKIEEEWLDALIVANRR